jgi:DNA-binding NarL/FixJ family response regulator
MIRAQPDMNLVGQFATAEEGIRRYRELRPDVTLMDLRLPDMTGIEALIAIRTEFVNARIVMLTTFQGDADVQRALKAGAQGFLVKTMPPHEILASIRQVHAGKKSIPAEVAAQVADYLSEEMLTQREVQILGLIAAGNRNRDVADALAITEDTVKVHVKHILEKLGAADRTEAVVISIRRGIIKV